MKKSEAINKIANFLLNEAPDAYNTVSSYTRRLDAEHLLYMLENEIGMVPPSYNKMEYLGLDSQESIEVTFFNWEPENE